MLERSWEVAKPFGSVLSTGLLFHNDNMLHTREASARCRGSWEIEKWDMATVSWSTTKTISFSLIKSYVRGSKRYQECFDIVKDFFYEVVRSLKPFAWKSPMCGFVSQIKDAIVQQLLRYIYSYYHLYYVSFIIFVVVAVIYRLPCCVEPGSVQDYSIAIANALEKLQSCN